MLMGHGSETEKYPLEVLFQSPGPCHDAPNTKPAVAILPCSVALSTGSSVTMASHLLCFALVKLNIFDQTCRPAAQQHGLSLPLEEKLSEALYVVVGSRLSNSTDMVQGLGDPDL